MARLRGLVLFALLLPGAARRSARVGYSHEAAQQEASAELQEDFFLPATPKIVRFSAPLRDRLRRTTDTLNVATANKRKTLPKRVRDGWTGIRRLAQKTDKYSAAVQSNTDKLVGFAREKAADPEEMKRLGVIAVISYALWEAGFWTAGGILRLLNLARFAIPLRIGLVLASAPWVSENIVQRFWLGKEVQYIDWDNFDEDFKVVDAAGVALESVTNSKALLTSLIDIPLNTGSGIDASKLYKKDVSGQPILVSTWTFELQERDLKDKMLIKELKKSFDFPLKVAGSCTFNLNEDSKVEQMQVGSWSINDQVINPDMASLPNLKKMSESDEDMLEQWAKDLVS